MTYTRTLYQACPLCEHPELEPVASYSAVQHPLWTPDFEPDIHWLRCLDCQHLFTDGHFEGPAFEALCQNTSPGQTPGENLEEGRLEASRVIEWVESVDTAIALDKSWLDIGIGNGSLVTTAHEFGYITAGLDVRPAAKMLGEYGVLQMSLDEYSRRIELKNGRFGVVSMGDVLEHVPYPAVALAQVRELLAPRGLLYLSTPNAGSYAWNSLETSNPYWRELEHYHCFTRQRLEKLFRQLGFLPLRIRASQHYRLGLEYLAIRTPEKD